MTNSPKYRPGWKERDDCCQTIFKNAAMIQLVGKSGKGVAARQLNVSTTAITGRIRTLERELGVPLIEKRRKNAGLTPAGKELLRACEQAVRAVDPVTDNIVGLKERRFLRVAVSKANWDTDGEQVLAAFARRAPDVGIELFVEDGYLTIENHLREGIVDLGIVSGLPANAYRPPGISRQPWRNDFMSLITPEGLSPRTYTSDVQRKHFEDLHDRFFTAAEHDRLYGVVNDYLEQYKIKRFFKYVVPLPDMESIIENVELGAGVSILPEPIVDRFAGGRKIDRYLLSPPLRCRLDCVFAHNGMRAELVETFLDGIAALRQGRP